MGDMGIFRNFLDVLLLKYDGEINLLYDLQFILLYDK